MTCSDFLQELTDYLDGAMDAQTRAELEDHLQWCHNCYVVCNTTKMTIEIYRDSQLSTNCLKICAAVYAWPLCRSAKATWTAAMGPLKPIH